MERHQHAVIEILRHLGWIWVYASHKPELLTTSMMVFGRERPTFGDEIISIASYCFQFFFSCQHRTTGVLCEFLWFFGVRLDIWGWRQVPAKQWNAWVLNSSKSWTRLKFMNLGMLSCSGINMSWYKFCPIWGRFGYMLLTNRSFAQQAWWFSVGNIPPLGTKLYPLPLIAFNFFLVST